MPSIDATVPFKPTAGEGEGGGGKRMETPVE